MEIDRGFNPHARPFRPFAHAFLPKLKCWDTVNVRGNYGGCLWIEGPDCHVAYDPKVVAIGRDEIIIHEGSDFASACRHVWITLYSWFALQPDRQKTRVTIYQLRHDVPRSKWIDTDAVAFALGGQLVSEAPPPGLSKADDEKRFDFARSTLYQLYHLAYDNVLYPHVPTTTELKHPDPVPERVVVRRHPLRPPTPTGTIYSRMVSHIDRYTLFNLRPISENDIGTVEKWMNDPRVNAWWGEASKDRAKHQKFVKERIADKHTTTVIGSFETVDQKNHAKGESKDAVYSEIYWVFEDRLGVKMEEAGFTVDPYDRGIHQLVGSSEHRGPHRVRAWLPSLVHYCFISDPRTKNVWCEPNEQNHKMVSYLCGVGFERVGTIYFSHKTSALMRVSRERFYELCPF